jgi:hypothetical protein
VRGQRHAPAAFYPPWKDPVPIVQEDGWAPGPVWTGAENLAPSGVRYPDRPARSQSLYRLSYPAPNRKEYQEYFVGEKSKGGQGVGLIKQLYMSIILKSGSVSHLETSGLVQTFDIHLCVFCVYW